MQMFARLILDNAYNKIINAEFSLQSASHNSRINHQRCCWWQIRQI